MRIHLVPTLVILGSVFAGAASAELPSDSKQEPNPSLVAGNLDSLWSDLADADAAKAFRAIWALTKTPKETVTYIAGKMEPAVAPDPVKVKRLIEDLNSETFTVREKANQELIKLGGLVELDLRQALKANASLETRQRVEKLINRLLGPMTLPDHLRAARAVETLENIGTDDAKALLAKYAAGAPHARLTQDAQETLARLAKAEPFTPPKPSRTDLYGDPLPAGAVGRLGTIRFRRASDGGFYRPGLAFLPDGLGLVTGGDHSVQVFEVPSGKLLNEIESVLRIGALVLAPDGKHFAASGYLPSSGDQPGRYEIQVCAVSSGKVIRSFPRKERDDVGMAFSPDCKLLFSLSSREGVVLVEDIASGREEARRKFPSPSSGLALSSDGKCIAVGSRSNIGKLFLWKWREGEPRELHMPGREQKIRFSPDGKLLAGVEDLGSLLVWEVSSGRLLWQQKCTEKDFTFFGDLDFTPDGKTLALTIRNRLSTHRGKIQLVDPNTGASQGLLECVTRGNRLALSSDSRLLAMATDTGVRLWDMASRQELTANLEAHDSNPSQIIVSPKGFLVTASDDNTVRLWDASTTKHRKKFVGEHWMRAIALPPGSTLIAASSLDDAVHVWDARTDREIYRLAGHGTFGGQRTLGFLPDGQGLLSWGDDFYLRLWDMKSGKARFEHPIRPQGIDLPNDDDKRREKILELDLPEGNITPDGKTLVLDIRGHFHLFDTGTGKETSKFPGEGTFQTLMAIAPNSKSLLASMWGNYQVGKHTVSLIDLSSGTTMQRLLLPGSVGGPVAFSTDGRMFATSVEGPQREILLFEAASGKARATIRGVPGRVWSLAFFPDGRRLASGLSDSTVVIWDLATPEHFKKGS